MALEQTPSGLAFTDAAVVAGAVIAASLGSCALCCVCVFVRGVKTLAARRLLFVIKTHFCGGGGGPNAVVVVVGYEDKSLSPLLGVSPA